MGFIKELWPGICTVASIPEEPQSKNQEYVRPTAKYYQYLTSSSHKSLSFLQFHKPSPKVIDQKP